MTSVTHLDRGLTRREPYFTTRRKVLCGRRQRGRGAPIVGTQVLTNVTCKNCLDRITVTVRAYDRTGVPADGWVNCGDGIALLSAVAAIGQTETVRIRVS